MRNNDVPEILFPTKATLLAAGNTVSDLAVGQLGMFSEATGLSITEPTENFFLAVGLDNDGDGVVDDVRKSAGRNIQPGNILYATRQDYVAPVDQVVDITDIEVKCGDSFGIKIEARNEQIYNFQGTVQYRETFVAKADECDACADNSCTEANVAKLVKDIVLQAKLGKDPFFKVEAISAEGTVLTDEALQTIVDATEALEDKSTQEKVGIRVTAIANKVQQFANVNLDYVQARQTQVFITAVGELTNKYTITEKTALVYEQGSGYDVRELEFNSIGFREGNTGAYRIGAITGLPNEVAYESDLKKKYTVFTLAYDHKHRNGSWLQYDNALATYFVVENGGAAVATVNDLLATLVGDKSYLAHDGDIKGVLATPSD